MSEPTTRVLIHLDRGDTPCFWAESPDYPRFSAVADTMAELKQLCREAAEMEGWPQPSFTLAPSGPGYTTNGREDHA
jgi:hypothetical protein